MATSRSSKRRKIEKRSIDGSDSQPSNPTASLMGIPREVRLEILKHLLPTRHFMPFRTITCRRRHDVDAIERHLSDDNQLPIWRPVRLQSEEERESYIGDMVYNYWDVSDHPEYGIYGKPDPRGIQSRPFEFDDGFSVITWKPMRHDYEACTMGVGRVNRVLSEEVQFLMHHGRVYNVNLFSHRLFIKGSNLNVAAMDFEQCLLPLTANISSLYLTTKLTALGNCKSWPSHPVGSSDGKEPWCFERIISTLAKCPALRRLIVEICSITDIHPFAPETMSNASIDAIGSYLQKILEPLRQMRELDEVRFLFMAYATGLSKSSVAVEHFIRHNEIPKIMPPEYARIYPRALAVWKGSEDFNSWVQQLRSDMCG